MIYLIIEGCIFVTALIVAVMAGVIGRSIMARWRIVITEQAQLNDERDCFGYLVAAVIELRDALVEAAVVSPVESLQIRAAMVNVEIAQALLDQRRTPDTPAADSVRS